MKKGFNIILLGSFLIVALSIVAFNKNKEVKELKQLNRYNSQEESFYKKAFELNIKLFFGNLIDSVNELENLLQQSLDKGYYTNSELEIIRTASDKVINRFEELQDIENLKGIQVRRTVETERDRLSQEERGFYNIRLLVYGLNPSDKKGEEEKCEITEEGKAKINTLLDFCEKVKYSGAYSDDLAKDDRWIKHLEDWMEYIFKMR